MCLPPDRRALCLPDGARRCDHRGNGCPAPPLSRLSELLGRWYLALLMEVTTAVPVLPGFRLLNLFSEL